MFRRRSTLVMAAVAALVLYGCTADGPTAPQAPLPPPAPSNSLLGSLTRGLTGTATDLLSGLLVQCEPLPGQSASKVIGRAGGTISVGPHKLVIPRGALSRDTRITAYLPPDDVASVQFAPEGLRFARPASLTLSYAHCRQLLPLPIQIAYTTDDLNILDLLRSNDDRRNKRVSAPLDHFSRYAASWRSSKGSQDDDLDGGLDGDDGAPRRSHG